MALNFLFLSIFLSFPRLHVYIKICVRVYSVSMSARILKLMVIHVIYKYTNR